MQEPVDLLPQLYEAATDSAQWGVFLKRLSQLVNSRVTILMARDEKSRRCDLVECGADPDALKQYNSYFWSIDTFANVVPQRGFNRPGSVYSSEAFVSRAELLETEYANDFLLKFDMFHHCFVHLGIADDVLSSLTVVRGLNEESFGPAEEGILTFLSPHIQQAIRMNGQFRALRASDRLRKAALDQLDVGVVFLSPKGTVLGMNEAADAILRERDGLVLHRGRVCAAHQADDQKLQHLISRACSVVHGRGTAPGGAMLVAKTRSEAPLKLILGTVCGTVAGGSSNTAAILFIHDSAKPSKCRDAVLRSLYGLTAAETRLASLVMDGKSKEEITAELQITRNTLKSHLKSVFSKVGVRRQADLVRKMMD